MRRWALLAVFAVLTSVGRADLTFADAPPPTQAAPDALDQQALAQIDNALGALSGRSKAQQLGLRAVLGSMLGKPDQAATQLDREAEKAPDSALAVLRDGLVQFDAGDLDAASAAVDRALGRDPNLEAALLMRGVIDCALSNGRMSADFSRLAAQAGDSALGRWSAAVAALADKRYDEATRLASAAIEADPDFVFSYLTRGSAYGEQHDYPEAIRDFERAVKLAPQISGAYVGLCLARLLNRDRQQAVEACDIASEMAPEIPSSHMGRAMARTGIGDYPTALTEVQIGISQMPEKSEAYLLRGYIHARMHEDRTEIADIDAALALKPNDPAAYGMRCDAYYALNEFADAMVDCNRSLAIEPGNYNGLAQRALVESALHDFDAALADLKAAIRSKPQIAFAYVNLGKIYADHGDEDLAGAALDKAASLDPGDGDIYVARASVDLFQHDFAKTYSDAQTATRLGFGSPLMSALEGYSAIALDKNAEAVEAFHRRVEQQPANAYASIWLFLAEEKAGATPDEALRTNLRAIDPTRWTGMVAALFLRTSSIDAVNGFAESLAQRGNASFLCEAGFFTGEELLLENRRDLAQAAFGRAVAACPRPSPSGAVAAAELANLHN